MSLANLLRFFKLTDRESEHQLRAINHRRKELSELTDDQLKAVAMGLTACGGGRSVPKMAGRRPAPPLPVNDLQVGGPRPASGSVVETFALAAVIAERILGLRMFDVQILGALAMQRGDVAEMQTGEGKTLAAVPAAIW